MEQSEQHKAPKMGQIMLVLNLLAHSTGKIYYLHHCGTHQLRFTDNITTLPQLSVPQGAEVSMTYCDRQVDPRDRARLREGISALIEGRQRSYVCSCRLKGQGEPVWINNRGILIEDPADGTRYILGQISLSGGAAVQEESLLPRGSAVLDTLGRQLARRQRGYLLLLGLDNLKSVNLRAGREAGDRMLSKVGGILGQEAAGCEVYRIGGDWFALLLTRTGRAEVEALFERVRARLRGACTLSGGCVSYTDYHVDGPQTLLQYAETALYAAKEGGKDRLAFFTPEDYQSRLHQLELQEELRCAVERGFAGFSVYFQPQLRAEDGALVSAEALLRYRSPRMGQVHPDEMVPLLERTGLICPVGLWAVREALRCCRRWREKLPDFSVGVNMSYTQLEQSGIADRLLDELESSGLPGSALTVEVTESIQLTDYPHLNEIFRRWKRQGIRLSVDDFGTGYSSLGRLRDLEVDELKIDRSFVQGLQSSAYNYRLLNNIIELAQAEGIRVCCEGVETTEELAALRTLGPMLIQGFLGGRPCPAENFWKSYLLPAARGARFLPAAAPAAAQERPADGAKGETAPLQDRERAAAQAILSAENDIICLSDPLTHEIYYMNTAAQKLFGVRDYLGKKCYAVLHGSAAPCDFCTNHLLRRDSFYLWENNNRYCGRRFLIKDKLVQLDGRELRLEIALDITRQEYVSRSAQERLAFAEKITEYTAALAECEDYRSSVQKMLAAMGSFYQADRAYLFEPRADRRGHWYNSFEWCAVGVQPQREKLQDVPPEAMSRWMKIFEEDRSVILLNLDPVRDQNLTEWRTLTSQGIQRLIASPLRRGGRLVGFVGVDNPRTGIHDDTQVRVLGSFLLTQMRAERSEQRYKALLRENGDVLLQQLLVGQWMMSCSPRRDQDNTFLPDPVTRQMLAIPENLPPRACFERWMAGLDKEACQQLEEAFEQMFRTARAVRVVYRWNHPEKGPVLLRFSGILVANTAQTVQFRGYCAQADRTLGLKPKQKPNAPQRE